jgi:hypothetical protein
VSGYSVEQIASHTKKNSSAIRGALGQALAKRRLDAPEDHARFQVARPTKGLRCADLSLEEEDLKAIAPFVKVVRELNFHHGVNVGPTRTAPVALPEIAPTSPPLALTHSPGVAVAELFEGDKSCARAQVTEVLRARRLVRGRLAPYRPARFRNFFLNPVLDSLSAPIGSDDRGSLPS